MTCAAYRIRFLRLDLHQTPTLTHRVSEMGIDILDLIDARGGNAEAVRESQRRRNASVELVDECIGMYEARTKREPT